MSWGLTRICPCIFWRQSRELLVVGLNIFLWMVLGLLLSRALYFVMAILQLIDVCLVMILWASLLAFLPILASSSTQVCKSAGLVGKGGILGVWINWRDMMSGSL